MTKRSYVIVGLLLVVGAGAAGLAFLTRPKGGELPDTRWPGAKPPTDEDNRAAAESAKPILDAIYQFKYENGLWPSDLNELVPKYMKKQQVADWRYTTRHDGHWKLISYAGFPHTAVQFRYLKDEGGRWEVSWGDGEAELKVPYAPPGQANYHAAGEKEKCTAVLRKAAQSPLDTLSVEWEDTGENFGSLSGDSSAWYAALLAYREQWLDVCLAVCDRWERYIKHEKKYGAPGFNVFQAACYLNQGRFKEAKAAIEEAAKPPPPNYGFHLDKQVARLGRAIEQRDQTHRYDPRDAENDEQADNWKLLINYE